MLGTVGALLAGRSLAEHEDALLHLVGFLMLVSLLVGAALSALLSNHDGCLRGMEEGRRGMMSNAWEFGSQAQLVHAL